MTRTVAGCNYRWDIAELSGAVDELAPDCTTGAQRFTTVAKQEAGH